MKIAFINETTLFNKKLIQMPYFEYCKGFILPVTIYIYIYIYNSKHEHFNRYNNLVYLDGV
jgi:hypothetical protein